jgi:hypothetical protein
VAEFGYGLLNDRLNLLVRHTLAATFRLTPEPFQGPAIQVPLENLSSQLVHGFAFSLRHGFDLGLQLVRYGD